MKFLLVLSAILATSYGAAIKENTTITFSLFATGLNGCDPISACDTSVTILCSSVYSDWKICGQTKKMQNNNNPVWPEVFTFEHEYGSRQRWRLDLKDHDPFVTRPIASFNVVVDDFSDREGNLLQNDIPDNRGILWLERKSNE